jgi:exonuclease III
VHYSGDERAETGVAIVVHTSIVKSVVKKHVCSDRIIAVKLKAEPVSTLIVQAYMPTSEYEDDEVEELYDLIEEILEEDGKGETNTIIIGDWNTVVGDKAHHNIVGPYGLGRRNKRGQMLIDFCERNRLVITNTWFKKRKRRSYMWKAKGDRTQHHLDYILVKQRFRNNVKDVQTLPGADIDSDHKLLVARVSTRLKKIIRFQKQKPKWDLEKLHV